MKRVLFFNVSAAGHVIPTFGLVKELIRRGHEVTYFEAPPFQEELEAFGASFRSYGPIRPFEGPMSGDAFHNEWDLAAVLTWCALEWLPDLLERVKAERPDVIVHDSLSLWGRLVAQLLDIPAICVIATAALNAANTLEHPDYLSDRPDVDFDSLPSIQYFKELEVRLRERYALPEMGFMDTFTNPQPLNICYLPRALQPGAEHFGDTYHFVGPCDPERKSKSHDFSMDLLTGAPLVFISFGSIHDPGMEVYQACIDALRDKPVQVVMLTSPSMQPSDFVDVPDHILLRKTGTVPQLELLERAAVFLMHGAGGAAREGAWHGVPMLAVPQTYEQDIIARCIASEGAGLRLPQCEVNPASIREAVIRLQSEASFRENAEKLGRACRKAGGAIRAVDLLEQHLSSL